jgi:RNA-directed DNA polymerase
MQDERNFTTSTKTDLSIQRMDVKRSEVQQVEKALLSHDSLTDCLMEKICESRNLNQAYKRVKSNKGAPGIDGITVDDLKHFIAEHKEALLKSLLDGSYRPNPVREVEIPKPGKKQEMRKLGIPCAIDRVVQQAILQVLQPIFEPGFSESSFGFRPGRSAHQAVKRAQSYVQAGYRIVVDLDVEKFFDRMNHDILMSKLAKVIRDKRVLKVIRALLTAGIMKQGIFEERGSGTPQGSPLSPLLSNIMLDELDKELEKRGHKSVRYADDNNVYVKSKRAGERVMESLKQFLWDKLRLRINEGKSKVAKVVERQFLGFRLLQNGKISLSKPSLAKVKQTIRYITRRNRGRSLEQIIAELNVKLGGWVNYFKFTESPSMLRDLDSWIRRKLRCYRLKQRKRSYPIAKFLIGLGVSARNAWSTAKSEKGWWRLSSSPAIKQALSNEWFEKQGLIGLYQRTVSVEV